MANVFGRILSIFQGRSSVHSLNSASRTNYPVFRQVLYLPNVKRSSRYQCTKVIAQSEDEKRIAKKIQSKLSVSKIEVEDISGGCGSMYRIFVAADEFKGKRTIQQHRMINDILQDEVKDMHGLTLHTTSSL
ncbi:bolA-like protein 3 [Dendronephthya gigantea]|uniref:bolA-like protein 3 n=1 Tax=Dendronephthya gigantea TaxID=151771 RepID=UPI00106C9402|nr:bolA-like protein 3 [Dendronephthya gigantea]